MRSARSAITPGVTTRAVWLAGRATCGALGAVAMLGAVLGTATAATVSTNTFAAV